MPPRRSRVDAFCQAYLAEPNAAEAARHAGYSATYANRQGWRLLRHPAVAERLAALRAELAERECLSRNAQLAKLEAAYRAAMAKAQPGVAGRLVESQIKLTGRFAETDAGLAAEWAAECAALRAALVEMARLAGLPAPRFDAAPGDKRTTHGGPAVDKP